MNYEILIKNGKMVDGTGAPPRRSDIGIAAGRIAAIGDLSGASAAEAFDAAGKYVTPGFMDIHAHLTLRTLGAQRITRQGDFNTFW